MLLFFSYIFMKYDKSTCETVSLLHKIEGKHNVAAQNHNLKTISFVAFLCVFFFFVFFFWIISAMTSFPTHYIFIRKSAYKPHWTVSLSDSLSKTKGGLHFTALATGLAAYTNQ